VVWTIRAFPGRFRSAGFSGPSKGQMRCHERCLLIVEVLLGRDRYDHRGHCRFLPSHQRKNLMMISGGTFSIALCISSAAFASRFVSM
jgi:hypothetical protein